MLLVKQLNQRGVIPEGVLGDGVLMGQSSPVTNATNSSSSSSDSLESVHRIGVSTTEGSVLIHGASGELFPSILLW